MKFESICEYDLLLCARVPSSYPLNLCNINCQKQPLHLENLKNSNERDSDQEPSSVDQKTHLFLAITHFSADSPTLAHDS